MKKYYGLLKKILEFELQILKNTLKPLMPFW